MGASPLSACDCGMHGSPLGAPPFEVSDTRKGFPAMKKMMTRFATALLLCVLCAAPAFAKAKSRLLTVGQDFAVGATTVKAGTYIFSVDSESNELTVLDKKTKAVIARAQTQ